MGSERKVQAKVWVSNVVWDNFHKIVARKWGIHKHGLLSFELEQALKYYNSVGGILPDAAHAHTNSTENNKVRSHHSKRVKDVEQVNSSATAQFSGFKGFSNIPQTSPLIQWVKKNGGFNFEERHYELAERLRSDPEYREQWHKDTMAKLRAKARRIDHYNWETKLKEADKKIRQEIRQIKQHLVTTDNIINADKFSKEQLHNAIMVVTGFRDLRTFNTRLKEYVQHEYFSPINREETFFSAGTKFLEI